jgi:hypothetical protein
MVKPNWSINASDSQAEGGGFFFIRYFSYVFSRHYTMWIIAHWNIYLQQLIQRGKQNCKICKIIGTRDRKAC